LSEGELTGEKPFTKFRMTEIQKDMAEEQVWALKFVVWFRSANHKENENAVRARAGVINFVAVSVICVLSISYVQESDGDVDWSGLGPALYPVMMTMLLEFLISSLFGLAVSPLGVLATILSYHILGQKPVWKPARPKRFAWFLGMCMVASCVASSLVITDTSIKKPLIISFASVCCLLTYLEASCGVCVGCWMFGTFYNWRYKDANTPTTSC
jgi:hypothetical protein